ncbi:MAG: hypothetical protein P8Y71_05560, partial [Pseudolabrys sp.]
DARLQAHVTEKAFRSLILAAHRILPPKESRTRTETHSKPFAKRLFQHPAKQTSGLLRLRPYGLSKGLGSKK